MGADAEISENEQQKFWAGDFGDEYIDRNLDAAITKSNIVLFSKIFSNYSLDSCRILELGANVGLNIAALKFLYPTSTCDGVEINSKAASGLSKVADNVYQTSIENFESPTEKYDLVFTKTVLIHINPDRLNRVYDILYNSSKRYIMVCEYYNPHPVSVPYRGHENKLFKRDFAGELLDKFSNLTLINCGFTYHRDQFPQDDLTWFLLRKEDS